VLPTQTLVALGSRDRWAKGDSFALALSFDWHGVMRGAFAHAAGYPEMYLGAAVVLLAACALVAPWRDGGAPQLFVLVAIAGLVLVAGATLTALPWLVHHVPGFALLRIPGRYKLLAAWCIAAAAGYGAASLEGPRPRAALIAVAAALAASIYTVTGHGTGKLRPEWWSIAAMVVPCALVIVAACVPRLRTLASSALVVVVLLDAPAFTHTPAALPASDPRRLHERDDAILARLDGIRDRWRLYDEFVLGERVGQRRAVRDFRGYPALDPLSQQRYVDVLDYAKRDPAILTDMNVRWVLQGYHFRFGTTASFVPPLGAGAGAGAFVARGDGIFEARNPAPLVVWYGATVLVTDPKRVLSAVRRIEERSGIAGGGDPDGFAGGAGVLPRGIDRRRAVIEPDAVAQRPALAHLELAAPAAVTGTLVSYAADEIELTVEAPREGIVVLNELAFPGWTVEVDGAPAVALRANYLLRAVYTGPGHHAIRWRFAPPGQRGLVDGYLLALAIMAVAAAWPRRSRTATPPSS